MIDTKLLGDLGDLFSLIFVAAIVVVVLGTAVFRGVGYFWDILKKWWEGK